STRARRPVLDLYLNRRRPSRAAGSFSGPIETFIEAPQNVRYLRYLLVPINETNGISAILGS
ncbi:hypothetical protein, partial [Mesorhizobium sp. M0085]|uniref:hypothetical protein n=1 Tax=Mesorhizobium sp. M0085 TaxID=2956872 RepID=UPI00333D1B45